jgi:hypothetical protein
MELAPHARRQFCVAEMIGVPPEQGFKTAAANNVVELPGGERG